MPPAFNLSQDQTLQLKVFKDPTVLKLSNVEHEIPFTKQKNFKALVLSIGKTPTNKHKRPHKLLGI